MQFDIHPFLEASFAVQVHAAAGLFAIVVGTVVIARRKGGRWHRWLGRSWMIAMMVIAVSSFWIHQLRVWGAFSPLHLLSVSTLATVGFSIWAIRQRNVRAHAGSMIGLYLGGCLLAGGLTLAPGLLMNEVFIGTNAASPALDGSMAIVTAMGGAFAIFGLLLLVEWRRRA